MFGRKQQGFTIVQLLVVLLWLLFVVIKLAVIGVVIWAIYKLVMHFTTSPAATAMLETVTPYLS